MTSGPGITAGHLRAPLKGTTAIATANGAKSGSTLSVTVNDTVVTVEANRDVTFAAGDVVLLNKVGGKWFAAIRLYTAAVTPATEVEAAPPPKPATVSGTLVVSPVETRSWRTVYGGWRTDNLDVYQGQYGGYGLNTGSVFYGSKPRSLSGATVTSARIQVRRLKGGAYAAQTSTMRLMTEATRPAGVPTLTSSTSGPSLAVGATSSSFTVPTSWAQAFVDGTAGGLAFYVAGGSPYIRFAGRGSWSPAFTLTINWTR